MYQGRVCKAARMQVITRRTTIHPASLSVPEMDRIGWTNLLAQRRQPAPSHETDPASRRLTARSGYIGRLTRPGRHARTRK